MKTTNDDLKDLGIGTLIMVTIMMFMGYFLLGAFVTKIFGSVIFEPYFGAVLFTGMQILFAVFMTKIHWGLRAAFSVVLSWALFLVSSPYLWNFFKYWWHSLTCCGHASANFTFGVAGQFVITFIIVVLFFLVNKIKTKQA